MRTEQIKYFLEIVQCGSVSAAAEKLFLNQPMLSHAIKSLENEVGGELFIRKNSGLTLSPLGEQLHPIFESIYRECSIITSYTKQNRETQDLYIIAGSLLPSLVQSALFSQLNEVFPETRFHYKFNSSSNYYDSLSKHLSDIAIGICSTQSIELKRQLANQNDLKFEIIGYSQMAVGFHPDNPLASFSTIEKKDLKEYPMILLEQLVRPNQLGLFNREGDLKFYENLSCFSDINTILNIVSSNLNYATMAAEVSFKYSELYKAGKILATPVSPVEKNRLCIYVLYREKEKTPQIDYVLYLLHNLAKDPNAFLLSQI